MELLQNPEWQGIGAIIVFITLPLSVIFFLKQRHRKNISYRVIADTPVLTIRKEIEDQVKMTLDNQPISDARLVILKIWNSGNVPILPNDYVEPIAFHFGENAEILDAEVLETKPSCIKASFQLEKFEKHEMFSDAEGKNIPVSVTRFRNLTLEPLLLNNGDSLTLKVLLTHALRKGDVTIGSRIIGIKQMRDAWKDDVVRLIFATKLTVLGLGLLLLVMLLAILFRTLLIPVEIVRIILLVSLISLIVGLPMLYFYSWKLKKSSVSERKSWQYVE